MLLTGAITGGYSEGEDYHVDRQHWRSLRGHDTLWLSTSYEDYMGNGWVRHIHFDGSGVGWVLDRAETHCETR